MTRVIGHNGFMRRRGWLMIGLLLLGVAAGRPLAEPTGPADEGRAIIRKALDRAVWNEGQNFAARYRARMTKTVTRFDDDGGVSEEDVGDYQVLPIDGAPYERRLTVGDRPLSDEERGWEAEREAAFREERRRGRDAEGEPADEENDIAFNETLIARYAFTLEGTEEYRNRPSYRVSFRPRSGRLPVDRRIDRALNRARGTVWIDRETYEAARVEFELIDRVRLWWGVLGTINQARGSLDRGPVLGDIWARIQFETYTDVRVVFTRTRRAEVRRWRNFGWVADE